MTQSGQQQTIRAEAAAWWVRLDRGELNARERAAFADWCAADPDHQIAFAEARALWRQSAEPAAALAAEDAARYAGLAAARAPLAGRRAQRRWTRPAFAAIALLLLAASWLMAPALTHLGQDLVADASTEAGTRQSLTLPDGSRAELAGNSALSFSFDGATRHVTLLRGHAYFEVAPDPARPFTVAAGDQWARVLGTAFQVMRAPDATIVTVTHGRVAVGNGDAAPLATLTAGMQAHVTETGLAAPVAGDVDLAAVLAWRQDRLVFNRRPLADVAFELESHGGGRILVWGDATRDRLISGTFPIADTAGTVTAIADTLDLTRVTLTPWLTLLY